MPLEELNESIYKRDFEPRVPRAAEPAPQPTGPHEHGVEPSVHAWSDSRDAHAPSPSIAESLVKLLARHKRLILILSVVLLIALIGFGFMVRHRFLFDAAKVNITLSGPEVAKTGEMVTLTLRYQNGNWLGLNQAEVIVVYPEAFRPEAQAGWEIREKRATYAIAPIASQGSGTITFSGTLQAFEKRTAHFQAILRSSPEGVSNLSETTSQWTTLVDAGALELDIVGPRSVVLGQSMEYLVKYRNTSQDPIDNLSVVVAYPEGFTLTQMQPRPTRGETTWKLSRLEQGASGQISLQGELRGNAGDARRLLVKLGEEQGDDTFLNLAQAELSTRVTAPPLTVQLTLNNEVESAVDPGQSLAGKFVFVNNSDASIRDIIATVTLEANLLDLTTLAVPAGVTYDRAKQQLIFKGSEFPTLRLLGPKEQGEIGFGVGVKSDIARLGRKNIEIKTSVLLDSPDLPHGQNTAMYTPYSESRVKVHSPVHAIVQTSYTDVQFPNTGPLPPQIDQLTTYTVRLTAFTDINPVNKAVFSFTLPGTVRFLDHLSGDTTGFRHNERTGEVVWEAGTIQPGSADARQLVFRIGLTPTLGSGIQSPTLIQAGTFRATDTFTGKTTDIALPAQSTDKIQ